MFNVSWVEAVLLLLLIGLGYIIHKAIITPFLSPLKSLPTVPRDNVFLGSWPTVLREDPGAPHLRWASEMGPFVLYHLHLGSPRLLITDPTALFDVRGLPFIRMHDCCNWFSPQVLVKRSKLFERPGITRNMLKEAIGAGLLSVEGDVSTMATTTSPVLCLNRLLFTSLASVACPGARGSTSTSVARVPFCCTEKLNLYFCPPNQGRHCSVGRQIEGK